MWGFASNCIAGHVMPKNDAMDSSDNEEVSSMASKEEEGLECPICWESFNLVENIPYVLWCGHTLCKNCILGLQWAVVKFPTSPLQLPLFISCPWCNLLSFRLVYRDVLKFPRKNFFLLWMLESMNGDRAIKSQSSTGSNHQPNLAPNARAMRNQHHTHHHHHRRDHYEPSGSRRDEYHLLNDYLTMERLHSSLRKSLALFVHLTAKFPLVIIFMLIVIYVIPASAVILALYVVITVVFAVPSFLILYFSYPSLDWLVREIIT